MNPARLEQECQTYARYLVGQTADPYVVRKYVECHASGRVTGPRDAMDRILTDISARGPFGARLADVVYWLLTWTADLAAMSSGGAPRFNPDRRDALAELGARVARVRLFRYYRALLQQRELLGHPLQPRLVAEALLFEYQQLFG